MRPAAGHPQLYCGSQNSRSSTVIRSRERSTVRFCVQKRSKMQTLHSAIILLGIVQGIQSQICNVTIPTKAADGSIHQKTQIGCCPGYAVAKIPRSTKTYCKAICKKPCINGRCTAPNTCTCKDGYEFESEFTQTTCVPKCDNCTNGSCLRPNVCQCRLKFHKNDDGICVPNCDPPCQHGTCTGPNVCQCKEGYRLHPGSLHQCEPVCEFGCHNGVCSGVNECTCFEGFTKEWDNPHRCERRECRNGVLDSDGRCTCDKSGDLEMEINEWIENNTIISECVTRKLPNCEDRCIQEECPEVDKCHCQEGYELISSPGKFKCIPQCDRECINGQCVAPNQCQCLVGYLPEIDDNGQTRCAPVCDRNCTNGFCSAPNVCSCDEGFAKIPDEIGECLPVCENCTALNQVCLGPGDCQCTEGFKMASDLSGCVEIVCNFGVVINGECQCADGFTLDESGTCSLAVDDDQVRVNDVTFSQSKEMEMDEDIWTYATSDVEDVPTTESSDFCLNGQVIEGECVCSESDERLLDDCVPRIPVTEIQPEMPENSPKIGCSEKCITGQCHSNGTCKCAKDFKLSPDDETECVPKTVCEMCFNDDRFPCPQYCFSSVYSPVVPSKVPQYLLITLACLISMAIGVIALVLYKRMQKHEYYTGAISNASPIYAYEMETLT